MIQAKNELQYRLTVELLERLAESGYLSDVELAVAKQLAVQKYRPQAVWE